MNSYQIWMGFSFERLIRANQHLLAKLLGFAGLPYKWGVFYNRNTIKKVLITNYGAKESVINKAYFDQIITVDDLMKE